MARKKRRARRLREKLLREGHLKELWELFFLPILRRMPRFISPKDWLSNVFCEETRSIVRYEAMRTFKLPGKLLVAPNIPIGGLGYRKITKGTILWIRYDTTMPDKRDIETQGRGKKSQVFQLNEDDWDLIKINLVQC